MECRVRVSRSFRMEAAQRGNLQGSGMGCLLEGYLEGQGALSK